MVSQLEYKKRIASTKALQKIFNAQELIASSRIAKAREFAINARPFSNAITKSVLTLARSNDIEHPFLKEPTKVKRAGVLVVAANRGMAGSYTSQILRESEAFMNSLREKNVEPVLFVFGKRAASYYQFQGVEVEKTWEGATDAPGHEIAEQITDDLVSYFLSEDNEKKIDEVHIIYTDYINMVSQKPTILRLLPARMDTQFTDKQLFEKFFKRDFSISSTNVKPTAESKKKEQEYLESAYEAVFGEKEGVPPIYIFEPSLDALLDRILPMYFSAIINECLLSSAASETAFRQNAMTAAKNNTSDLIDLLTIKANRARQESITNELTEIIAGSDALEEADKKRQ